MQEMGNGKAREIYEATLPDNFRRPNEGDSYALEQFIRAKYERKEYLGRENKPSKASKKKVVQREDEPVKKVSIQTTTDNLISLSPSTPTNFSETPINIEFSGFQSAPVTQLPRKPSFSAFEEGSKSSLTNQNFSGFQGAPSSSSENFLGFQSASNIQSGLSGFQGSNFSNGTLEQGFIGSRNSNTISNLDSESVFFSGDTHSTAKPSKQSILQLYNAPNANNPLPNSFTSSGQQSNKLSNTAGPNYNIAMPGLGMPATPQIPIVAPNYFPQTFNQNFVAYRSGPNFVNTNGYINANYQAAQQSKFL